MHKYNERRSTYLRIRDGLRFHALSATSVTHKEVLTCRVMVNIGLELVICGVEMLKSHGISKEQAIEFLDRLYATPGAVEGMEKGGTNESLLRLAMNMINGEIIRHTAYGDVREEASVHSVEEVPTNRNSRTDWN